MDKKLKDELTGALWGLAVLIVISLLCGCRTVKYVPVPSVSVDSVYVDRWQRDSVYVRDSVFVNQWKKGDTVFIDKMVTKYKYRDRWRYDTVAIVRRDTVQVPYSVEKDLGWWQQTEIYGFRVLAAFLVIGLAWKYRKAIMAFIRKLI